MDIVMDMDSMATMEKGLLMLMLMLMLPPLLKLILSSLDAVMDTTMAIVMDIVMDMDSMATMEKGLLMLMLMLPLLLRLILSSLDVVYITMDMAMDITMAMAMDTMDKSRINRQKLDHVQCREFSDMILFMEWVRNELSHGIYQ